MPTAVEKIKSQLKKLSTEERTELAHFLIESLGQVHNGKTSDWDDELDQRVANIKAGRARGIAAEKVFSRLREKYS